MKVTTRENDLTVHICRYCGQPIEGAYAEYFTLRAREFGHAGPCPDRVNRDSTGEAKERAK